MLLTELTRAFKNRNFLIALVLGVATLGIGLNAYAANYSTMLENIASGRSDPFIYNSFDAVIWSRSNIIAMTLAPLIAVLPFADSLTFDRTSNYLRLLNLRSTRTKYVLSKFTANALAGGTVLTLAAIIIYVIASIIFPEGIPTAFGQQRIIPSGPLKEIYPQDPVLFVWMQIAISFAFGATYALIGMLISFLTDNRFIVLATPFIVYVGLTFALQALGLETLSPTATFNPMLISTSSWLTVFGQLGLLFLISTVGIFIASRFVLKDI